MRNTCRSTEHYYIETSIFRSDHQKKTPGSTSQANYNQQSKSSSCIRLYNRFDYVKHTAYRDIVPILVPVPKNESTSFREHYHRPYAVCWKLQIHEIYAKQIHQPTDWAWGPSTCGRRKADQQCSDRTDSSLTYAAFPRQCVLMKSHATQISKQLDGAANVYIQAAPQSPSSRSPEPKSRTSEVIQC